MKTNLRERTVKFNFKDTEERRFYLKQICTQINCDLLNPGLTAMDRSRYFNILIACVKLIHDMDKDSTVEDLEKRLDELEAKYAKQIF